jgi:ferrous iron transport protein B
MSPRELLVAVGGNPNTGKSTLFNALTGLRQHTGNWPGKTVARAEGVCEFHGRRYRLVDLPGTYSLLTATTDEEIARDFILFGSPDCTVVVVDATSLERNLNLTLQVLEIADRVVIALNLVDEARRKGIQVDHRGLARELGVPVVPTVGKAGEGVGDLMQAVEYVVTGAIRTRPRRVQISPAVEHMVDELAGLVDRACPRLPNARWIALRLLDGDDRVRDALRSGELARLAQEPERCAPRRSVELQR